MTLSAAAWIFWISSGAVIYSYAVYPALIFVLAASRQTFRDIHFILRRRNRRSSHREPLLPRVALLVAAHNEEHVIEAKLRNTLALDYPAAQMEFLLGLDASTDTTAERVTAMHVPNSRVFDFAERRGKLAVINDLMQRTTADIVVFSDANTMLEPDCVRKLVRHFAAKRTGAVCGELRLVNHDGKPQMESLYWKYEIALKFLENRLNCVLGANGAVYAVRRELYNLNRHWIVEDFQVPMEIRFAGHRVAYDPEAAATEETAPTFRDEFRRKVRIGAGDFQTLFGSLRFLNPFAGMPALAYFSHKVLRWMGPFLLLAALITSAWLALQGQPLYVAALAMQAGFYLLALVGWLRQRSGHAGGLTSAPFYFCAMNVALLLGFFRFIGGGQQATWQSTPRVVAAPATVKSEVPK